MQNAQLGAFLSACVLTLGACGQDASSDANAAGSGTAAVASQPSYSPYLEGDHAATPE